MNLPEGWETCDICEKNFREEEIEFKNHKFLCEFCLTELEEEELLNSSLD